MAYILRNRETGRTKQIFAGWQYCTDDGLQPKWTLYENGMIDGPIVFITEAALESAQLELQGYAETTQDTI